MGSHRHHVVTLHIGLVVIFTFVVELSEEVESHDGVKVNHHGQEPDSQSQLGGGGDRRSGGSSQETPRNKGRRGGKGAEEGVAVKAVLLQVDKTGYGRKTVMGVVD